MNKRKTFLLLTAVALLLAATVGGTMAYLFTSTDAVENTFEPGRVVPVIEESFNNTVKDKVFIWNSGNVDAYIRAAVVVTWQDASGNIYSKVPVKDKDYVITLPADIKWTAGSDGYYYYTEVIKASATKPTLSEDHVGTDYATAYLLTGCKVKEGANVPSGYSLHVEILTQAIQTEPAQVFTDANWGWTPSSGS